MIAADLPSFPDLDEAADYCKFKMKTAPLRCVVGSVVWDVWPDGTAFEVEGGES